MIMRSISTILILAALAASVACGYTIRRTPDIESVRIGPITNNTMEHGLEDTITDTLALYLMRSGIKVDSESAYAITGTIDDYSLLATAESGGVATYYNVTINGTFKLLRPDGTSGSLGSSSSFIVSFSADADMQNLMTNRAAANRSAIDNMASDIVAGIEDALK